jgi:flagellar assembly protein FliH
MTSSERARRDRLHGPQPGNESPAPNATDPAKPANSYARFIPREELGSFASWRPGDLSPGTGTGAGAKFGPGPAGVERRAANGDRRARAATPSAPPSPPPEVVALQQHHAAALKTTRQAGYQDGYRDGMVALESFKQTFARQITAQVGQLFESTDQQLQALQGRIAAAVAETAVRLAREVVRQEISTHPELILRVAEDAVAALATQARELTLKLHPDDQALLAQGAGDLLQRRSVALVGDASIARGGCLLSSDAGLVDARIETRWATAAAHLGQPAVAWQGEVLDLPGGTERNKP